MDICFRFNGFPNLSQDFVYLLDLKRNQSTNGKIAIAHIFE